MSRETPDFGFFSLMRSEASRLGTYLDFPQSASVRPRVLASAGFFYSGNGDKCVCAFCRQALEAWEPHDEPMTEHKKHSPHCLFLKGADVGNVPVAGDAGGNVSDAAVRRAPHNQTHVNGRARNSNNAPLTTPGIQLRPAALANQPPTNTTGASQLPRTLQARDLKARLDRPMAKRMIEIGFDSVLVKQAIYDRLLSAGEDFESAEKLAEAVLDLKDRQDAELAQRLQGTSISANSCSAITDHTGSRAVCKSCKKMSANTAFLPCKHVIFCHSCAQEPDFCQECGTRIKGTRMC